MPFAQSPLVENEVVARHLNQCLVKRATSRGRQNDVMKRASRLDRFDRAASTRSEEVAKRERHGFYFTGFTSPDVSCSMRAIDVEG